MTTEAQTGSAPVGTLYELLQNVTDATSFLIFAHALQQDHAQRGEHWSAQNIADYLAAALDWADSTHLGKTQGLNDAPPWKRFAMFLYYGRSYP
ncbi:hypothetical protein SAMN02745857_00741 [Andreprevotia lacus DSM 23236]|jgi:hypothetical protein|uniref:DUF7660 domain-containing protein n=1 Tax=Andreprevotia lacus DSM 23236 TaxID=1121001 RepID=A0A1W1X6I9_9NEIS|nr:hypothetical protein [Andreprevotia lacus]SMC19579.1 hypothetical protein SAMN02745857_00741 [Andreprevotia lacus DSM 23236]